MALWQEGKVRMRSQKGRGAPRWRCRSSQNLQIKVGRATRESESRTARAKCARAKTTDNLQRYGITRVLASHKDFVVFVQQAVNARWILWMWTHQQSRKSAPIVVGTFEIYIYYIQMSIWFPRLNAILIALLKCHNAVEIKTCERGVRIGNAYRQRKNLHRDDILQTFQKHKDALFFGSKHTKAISKRKT